MNLGRYFYETGSSAGLADWLAGALGAEPHTPLDIAVEETLQGLGCLGAHGEHVNQGSVSRS